MKRLLIGSYDFPFYFSLRIEENYEIIFDSNDPADLWKFGINSEDYWFEPNLINKENAKIQEFDEIITAEDGNIIIYVKGKDY